MRRNHPSKHRNKYQRRLASALIGGVLIFGIYLVHLGNTDTWQETGCAVVGSRVIPEGVQSERHIVMIYRGQYQLRYTVAERDYFIWVDSEWSDEVKEFVQSKVEHLPEKCSFRIRYNPLQPAQGIAIRK